MSLPSQWSLQHALTWQQHGGGGNTFSLRDVLEMPFDKAVWMRDELHRHRMQEADAIKKAIQEARGK